MNEGNHVLIFPAKLLRNVLQTLSLMQSRGFITKTPIVCSQTVERLAQ